MTARLGSRGQVLCCGCRQCSFSYHCSECSKAWRERAKARSRTGNYGGQSRRQRRQRQVAP